MQNIATALERYANLLEGVEADQALADLDDMINPGTDRIARALAMQHLAYLCNDMNSDNDVDEDTLADWAYAQIIEHALHAVTSVRADIRETIANISSASTVDFVG